MRRASTRLARLPQLVPLRLDRYSGHRRGLSRSLRMDISVSVPDRLALHLVSFTACLVALPRLLGPRYCFLSPLVSRPLVSFRSGGLSWFGCLSCRASRRRFTASGPVNVAPSARPVEPRTSKNDYYTNIVTPGNVGGMIKGLTYDPGTGALGRWGNGRRTMHRTPSYGPCEGVYRDGKDSTSGDFGDD